MSPKYQNYQEHRGRERRKETIHPIWRGVGFLMMVLIPVVSYAAVDVLLKGNAQNNWLPIPLDLLARPGDLLYRYIPDPMLYIKAIMFVIIVLLLYFVFTLVSFMVTSMTLGSTRRDPYYVPPVQRRRRNP
jgi:hypothetical protein